MAEALVFNHEQKEEAGGDSSGESYRSCTFSFVHALRNHPLLINLTADEAADAIDPALTILRDEARLPDQEETDRFEELFKSTAAGWNDWHRALGTTDCYGNEDDPLEDFLRCWSRSWNAPPGPIALERSRRPKWLDPGVLGRALAAPRRAGFRAFIAFCCELSQLKAEFYLPVAAIAEQLATHRKVVGRWREEAVDRGFLELVAPARPPHLAATYRFTGQIRERNRIEVIPYRVGKVAAQQGADPRETVPLLSSDPQILRPSDPHAGGSHAAPGAPGPVGLRRGSRSPDWSAPEMLRNAEVESGHQGPRMLGNVGAERPRRVRSR